MEEDECIKEQQQISRLTDVVVGTIGFVTTGGFGFSSERYKLVDAGEMYSTLSKNMHNRHD